MADKVNVQELIVIAHGKRGVKFAFQKNKKLIVAAGVDLVKLAHHIGDQPEVERVDVYVLAHRVDNRTPKEAKGIQSDIGIITNSFLKDRALY